jgi:hypothetical protein
MCPSNGTKGAASMMEETASIEFRNADEMAIIKKKSIPIEQSPYGDPELPLLASKKNSAT